MKIDLQMKCEHSFIFRCNKLASNFGYAQYHNKVYYYCDNHKNDLGWLQKNCSFSVILVDRKKIIAIHNLFVDYQDKFNIESKGII